MSTGVSKQESGARWERDEIISLLVARYANGEGINYTALVADGLAGMYAAARREFGDWDATIAAAGLPPDAGNKRYSEKRWPS